MDLPHRRVAAPASGIGLFLALVAVPASGQITDPSLVMQEHLRRIEQSTPPPPARSESEVTAPRPVAPASSAGVSITEIEFSRSELLEPEALQAVGQRYVGRTLGTADIQQLLDELATLYRNKGILTALPVLPKQDLSKGLMRILLVEGRLGNVRVKAPDSVDAEWVKRWFDLQPQAVVRSEDLRERLVRFNNVSDLSAQAQFVAGEQFGLSELAIDVAPPDTVRGWAFYETSPASGTTARQRLAAAGLRLSPLTLQGGRVDTAAVITDTSNTLTGSVSLPVGTEGWRTGLAATSSRTRIRLEAQGLTVRGNSSALTWDVGRTWVLDDPWVLTTGLSLGRWESRNLFYIDPTPDPVSSSTARNKLSVNGALQYENAGARGALRTQLTANVNESRYGFGDITGHWIEPLDTSGHWLWRIAGSARPVSRGPVSQLDQFQLGGADTVRGFDTSAASGEKGASLQLELRHRLPGLDPVQVEAYAFIDKGVAGNATTHKYLESTGVGFQARLPSGLGLDVLASHQLGAALGGRNRLLFRLVANW